ncbi:MAG: glycerol-3-phosphate dehydrogenase [Deltaproteobacteria bacterium]
MSAQHQRLFDARQRNAVLDEVDGGDFDLVVVGGGINGAGVAHDAALRGLRVLLVEQRDFAFGTSSRSSKLIHGGLRYLEHYQFKLVFEGTNERAALRRIAPHLVRPLMFALPVYEGDRHPLWLMDVGLWMYDSLSLFKVEKRHITLRSSKRMLEREPLLNPEGLTGGIIYYDCMTDDARMTLENAIAATELGSPVLTRAKVVGVSGLEGDATPRVAIRDGITDRLIEVSARGVVNCTGAWTDKTRSLAQVEDQIVRPTKGVHIVVEHDRLPCSQASALLAPQDGRVFFAIPWHGRTVLGTTDTDFEGDPGEIGVTLDDVQYLLAAANHHFPGQNLTPDDVFATWAGLRPLIKPDDAASESDVPREHKLYRDGRMVTIAGGKLTTYRRMAAETVDVAAQVADLKVPGSKSQKAKLPGARGLTKDFDALAEELQKQADLPEDVAQRLANVYGSRAKDVAAYVSADKAMRDRITPDRDAIFAEVAFAVERELALSVDDVMVRRTSLTLTAKDQGMSAVERVADVMGERLGWSDAERQASLDEYAHSVALSRGFRTELEKSA